jgi:hypothetical protein
LEDFAKTLGVYPPRSPVPSWWKAFDKWYKENCEWAWEPENQEIHDEPGKLLVRMEPFTYEDEPDCMETANELYGPGSDQENDEEEE